MSRPVIFIICIATLAIFIWLVHTGWKNRWGGPSDRIIVTERLEIDMQQADVRLALEQNDFSNDIWNNIIPLTVPLMHQVTQVPWGRTLVPEIEVRTFHDGQDAYFLFEWEDTEESRVHGVSNFPDSVAVLFSMSEDPPSRSIMMGFDSLVNIWQWKANLDFEYWATEAVDKEFTSNDFYSYERDSDLPDTVAITNSPCQDLLATRPGSLTLKEKSSISGRGQWKDGRWRVIMTRPLKTEDLEQDIQLDTGQLGIAFAVWNGEKGDRGSRKSISDWVTLKRQQKVSESVTDSSRKPSSETMAATMIPFLATTPQFSLAADTQESRLIVVKAKRFEYMPGEITVQKGERITLRLESLDVTHGLFIDGYEVRLKAYPGNVGETTFIADKPGRFTFRCSETCGPFHPYMIGFLTVEPNKRYNAYIVITLIGAVVLALTFGFSFSNGKKEDAEVNE